MPDLHNLEAVLEDIANLREGYALLQEVWEWYGNPENHKTVKTRKKDGKSMQLVERLPKDLHNRVNYFFHNFEGF